MNFNYLYDIDHHPFGMVMSERTYSNTDGYRFGFNGMEKDDEAKGDGNSLDFGARVYDSRLGRWMSLDPLYTEFTFESHYSFVSNSPLLYKDVNGEAKYVTIIETNEATGEQTTVVRIVDSKSLRVEPANNPGGSVNYHYYDVNIVQRKTIHKDGTVTLSKPKEMNGAYRASTLIKAKWYANLIRTRTEDEIDLEENDWYGIRWTTSKKGSFGQGNNVENGRISIRSENMDMLLGVLKFTKSANGNLPKTLSKAPKSLKDFVDKVKLGKKMTDVYKVVKDMYESVQEEDQYNTDGETCNSCKGARHDGFDYRDREGNVMDDQGDTLRKAN